MICSESYGPYPPLCLRIVEGGHSRTIRFDDPRKAFIEEYKRLCPAAILQPVSLATRVAKSKRRDL